MTDDQKQLLAAFDSKIRRLMYMYKTLKEENTALKSELSEKDKIIEAANENIDRLNLKYENLKIARVVSIRQNEITGAKKRLSKLVQEVDKCIALLNE
jgi:predicted RNase H-like nuclease (RuvC/YqgF family)